MDADSTILLASCGESKAFSLFSMYSGMTQDQSAPTSHVNDDVTLSSSSDNDDASRDTDIIPSFAPRDRKGDRDCERDQEGPYTLTTDDGSDELQDLDTVTVPQRSESDVSEGEAVVRVRRVGLGTCEMGSKVKDAVMTPVADLVKDSLDPQRTHVEAVAVTHQFYNQWARLPRVEDPDRDVTSSTRRPVTSSRMLTTTGSLKSYTLMNAIVRDKRSPIQNLADLFQLPNASAQAEAATTNERNGLLLGRSLSDTSLTRNGLTKSAGCDALNQGIQAFPPIVNPRAETAPGTSRAEAFPNQSLSRPSPRDSYFTSHSSMLSERLFGSDGTDKKRDFSRYQSGKWPCSSMSLVTSHSAPVLRSQQALPINTASLLFSSSIDMRNERYRLLLQKQPRGLFVKAKPQTEAQESSRERTKDKLHKDGSGANDAGPGVTCVEFIDLTEVQNTLHRGKRNEKNEKKTDGAEKRPIADLRSAKGTLRMVGSLAQRSPGPKSCDQLNGQHFLTVGTPLPIHTSVD